MLFLLVLLGSLDPKSWKSIVGVITAFTIGHSATLALAVAGIRPLDSAWIEFFIPVTILITALNALRSRNVTALTMSLGAGFFGLIHGLGFAGYLSALLPSEMGIWQPLLYFNLGVEAGQLCFAAVVIGLLLGLRLISKSAIRPAQLTISLVGICISVFLAVRNVPSL